MNAMREIIVMEKHTVMGQEHIMLQERCLHGLLDENGTFRSLSFCGKRFPISVSGTEDASKMAETNPNSSSVKNNSKAA